MQEVNKIEAYKQTKTDPKELVEFYKKRFLVKYQSHLDMPIASNHFPPSKFMVVVVK
jgi:glutathione S-transferase